MQGRRAWVVTAYNENGRRVIAVLPPRWDSDGKVREFIEHFHRMTCWDLDEQAASFRRSEPIPLPRLNGEGGVRISLITAGAVVSAHKSTILERTEKEGRIWIKYQPDSIPKVSVDPATYKVTVVAPIETPEQHVAQIDMRLSTLIPWGDYKGNKRA